MVEVALFSDWLTPTSLFVLLNIVIATILVSSATGSRHKHRPDTASDDGHPSPAPPPPPPVTRVPSLFSRVTSFNFTQYYPPYHYQDQQQPEDFPFQQPDSPSRPDLELEPEPEQVTRAPSLLSRVASFKFSGLHRAAQPDLEPEQEPARAPSLLSRAVQPDPARPVGVAVKEEDGQRGAGKAGQGQARKEGEGGGRVRRDVKKGAAGRQRAEEAAAKEAAEEKGTAEVDLKADDFINKFKQQLKLQRLESMLRYGRTSAAT